jgi:hypothetical protein
MCRNYVQISKNSTDYGKAVICCDADITALCVAPTLTHILDSCYTTAETRTGKLKRVFLTTGIW